jgi:hypothetical protein
VTDHLCACGVSAGSNAPRCRACPQLQGAAVPVKPPTPTSAPAGAGVLTTHSRWSKSSGTFGPTGRVVATLLLLLPLPIFAMALTVGFGIIGGGIYVLVIMPWALRDIWKQAAIPVQAPTVTPSAPRF